MPDRPGRVGSPIGLKISGSRWTTLAAGWMACVSALAAGEDDYLKQIQSEAAKVEQDPVSAPPALDEGEADIAAFEKALEKHYRGSYLFYKKLPRRSREEIFAEYAKGASITDIRKKIMNRFLNE